MTATPEHIGARHAARVGTGSPIDGRAASSVISLRQAETSPHELTYPLSTVDLASHILGDQLTSVDLQLIRAVEGIDWGKERLDMSQEDHRDLAARSVRLGIPVVHGFGNFLAWTHDVSEYATIHTNTIKGRPASQVASIFASPETIEGHDSGQHAFFDLTRLPDGMSVDQAISLMHDFYNEGPFGFRGATRLEGYPNLTSTYTSASGESMQTVQVIAPGYKDTHSNDFVRRYQDLSGHPFAAITSVNKHAELTHHRMSEAQRDFSDAGVPILMAGHHNERDARQAHQGFRPVSTTILGMFRDGSEAPMVGGRPTVTLERNGSCPIDKVIEIADRNKVNVLVVPSGATPLVPREYDRRGPMGVTQELYRRGRAARTRVAI